MLVIIILFEDGFVWVVESVNIVVVSYCRFIINMYFDMKLKSVFMLLFLLL